MQNAYLTENQVASVAQQLLQVLHHADKYNISHSRLDAECLFLQKMDQRKNTIQIKVGGFERVHLELLKPIDFDQSKES